MFKWKHDEGSLKSVILRRIAALGIAAISISAFAGSASAQGLLERMKNGDTIRLGFTNDAPSSYAGENNEPLGLVNVMTLDILKKMGVTKVESVVTDWGSLVPGLQAGRFDIITGGMWINPDRCKNVLFSEPIALSKDALIVPKGNPKNVHSYEDIRDKGLTFVTGTGYTAVEDAQKVGIPDDKIMQVAGAPEIVQAVKAGRADAGAIYNLTAYDFAAKDPAIEVADPFTTSVPLNYPAIAFGLNEKAAVDAFNAAMKDYIGSDEMMASVGKYGYTKEMLPDGTTTAELCKP